MKKGMVKVSAFTLFTGVSPLNPVPLSSIYSLLEKSRGIKTNGTWLTREQRGKAGKKEAGTDRYRNLKISKFHVR